MRQGSFSEKITALLLVGHAHHFRFTDSLQLVGSILSLQEEIVAIIVDHVGM